MAALRSQSMATRRYVLLLATLFGVLALTLAAVGIAGVTAVTAGQRTQEMGVRLALGAVPRQVIGLVVGQTLILAAAGVGLGFGLTWVTLPLLRSQLFGVSASDPFTFAGAPLVLLITAGLAAWLPAMRTARMHPWRVLRHE
jgi:ABC-type antimicrobial peptide transport system permease subunit